MQQCYLDNAATSFPKPESVYRAVDTTLRMGGASSGRGSHRGALAASRLLTETREQIATFMGAPDPSRVVFTASATHALNIGIMGSLGAGDHVVTTSVEHNSVLRPLAYMERHHQVKVTVVPANRQGVVDPSRIADACTDQTRMIVMTHVSNVTGAIQPYRLVAALARARGIRFMLDAAQSAGVLPLDIVTDGIDILAAPGHKGLLGPQGTGVLVVAPGVSLEPVFAGGTGTLSDQEQQPDVFPEGYEPGTHNLPGIAGLAAGVAFVQSVGVAAIAAKEHALGERLRQQLSILPGATLYGPEHPAERTGVVSCGFEGWDPAVLAFYLDHEYNCAVRAGLHCAPQAHKTIGSYPLGTLRISPGWFSSEQEIDHIAQAIAACLRKGSTS